jgi:hypothetical protein
MEVGGQRLTPVLKRLGKALYTVYRMLGGPQGRSRRVRQIPPPPSVFEYETIQPLAIRYTDYTIPARVIVTVTVT